MRVLTFVLVAFLSVAGRPAMGQDPSSASEEAAFVGGLAQNALAVLRDETVDLNAREEKLRRLLHDGFAMEKIGRFVVGRHWRAMTPDQQQEYQRLFAEWVLRSYASRLGGYSGQTFKIDKVQHTDQNDTFVRTRIVQASADDIRCDWRVRKIDGGFRVIDIVVEGISMLSTQRAEFTAVLRAHGPTGLIEALNARLSKFPAATG